MKKVVKYQSLQDFNLSHFDVLVKITNNPLKAHAILDCDTKEQFGIFEAEQMYGVVGFYQEDSDLKVDIDVLASELPIETFIRALGEIRHYALNNYNSLQLVINFNEVSELMSKGLEKSGFNQVSKTCYSYIHYTLVFNGSPKNGMSKSICNELEERYVNVEVIDAYSPLIKACIDCDVCINNPLKCVYDDMDEIYKKVYQATNIIIVTPVHVGGISAPLHAIFSRMQVFYNYKFRLNNPFPFCRKNGFAISVSGTDWGNQRIAVDTIFKHSLAEMNSDYLYHLYLTNSDNVTSYSHRLKNFYEEVDKYVARK